MAARGIQTDRDHVKGKNLLRFYGRFTTADGAAPSAQTNSWSATAAVTRAGEGDWDITLPADLVINEVVSYGAHVIDETTPGTGYAVANGYASGVITVHTAALATPTTADDQAGLEVGWYCVVRTSSQK